MAFWGPKGAISLKRVKIQKKSPWKAYRMSPSLFRTVPSPTPYGLTFPKIGVPTPHKTIIAIISGTGKATDFKCVQYIQRVHRSEQKPIKTFREKGAWAYPGTTQFFGGTPHYLRNGKSYEFQICPVQSQGPSEQKSIKNFREKGLHERIQGLPNFLGYPRLSQERVKAMKFKFCMHIYRLNRNKSPLKISGKVAVGVVKDSQKFSGHPYIWRIARLSL